MLDLANVANVLALALLFAAILTAVSALRAHSIVAAAVQLAATGALCAAATTLIGGDAMAVALVFAAIAPVLLLAAMLLTSPTARSGARTPWLTFAAGAVAAGTIILAADLGAAPPHAAPASSPFDAASFWIAPIIFLAAAACIALLGFGERGALRGRGDAP